MRNSLFFLLSFFPLILFAQDFQNKNLQSLVNAERAFSAMAKEKNTRDAFLEFMADDVVTFGPGVKIGKKHLEAEEPNNGWLIWEPIYSDISASGDFGFNTGPWEYRLSKQDTASVAFGDVLSVWIKQADGKWRVFLDIGVNHQKRSEVSPLTTTKFSLTNKKSKSRSGNSILDEEQKFITAYKAQGDKAYQDVLSSEARILRQGRAAFLATGNDKFISDKFLVTEFKPLGSNMSSVHDMAYAYGAITLENKETKKVINANYAHIWKKEDGVQWKLVADIITW